MKHGTLEKHNLFTENGGYKLDRRGLVNAIHDNF